MNSEWSRRVNKQKYLSHHFTWQYTLPRCCLCWRLTCFGFYECQHDNNWQMNDNTVGVSRINRYHLFHRSTLLISFNFSIYLWCPVRTSTICFKFKFIEFFHMSMSFFYTFRLINMFSHTESGLCTGSVIGQMKTSCYFRLPDKNEVSWCDCWETFVKETVLYSLWYK